MQLDVVLPTYNRQHLLALAVRSLLDARVPDGLEVRITVVDNNSTDGTRQTVERLQQSSAGRLQYLFESRPGKSHALNAGIAATTGELIGMIDDDEEVEENWYVRAQRAFIDDGVDFLGGPYVPRWGAAPPEWLPNRFKGVIGWVDGGAEVRPYDESYPGMLMGGNVVIKRSVLERIGPYSTSLGRIGNLLLASEDEDMYQRLLKAGARGLYLPDLIIFHHIPPERLTKSYFRRWCFWRGVSQGVLGRERREPVTYLAGVPRYRYGSAIRGLTGMGKAVLDRKRHPATVFADELAVWSFTGYFYGRHLFTPPR